MLNRIVLLSPLLILLFLVSCASPQRIGKDGYIPNNELPMYGASSIEEHMEKRSEYFKESDEKFIASATQKGVDSKNASSALQRYAWEWLAEGNASTAMKRFNQAALLNPDDPAILFGYAATLEAQGKTDLADSMLQKARTLDPTETLPHCSTDLWVIVLYNENKTEEAREKAQVVKEKEPQCISKELAAAYPIFS